MTIKTILLSGALAMVIDQDPDMQASMALGYIIERLDSNAGNTSGPSGCDFHVYFSENVKEGQYLSADNGGPMEVRAAPPKRAGPVGR